MAHRGRGIRVPTPRFAAVEARSSHRAMVWREWPVTRAVAAMLTPSTRRLATWSNSLRAQRRPLYAVPVCVLTVPPQTVQRYRQRRPHFVGHEPWPTMVRPSVPRVAHPRLAQAIPSIAASLKCTWGEPAVFAQDLGGEGDRSTATGASTDSQEGAGTLTHCGAGAACGYPGLHPSPPTPAGDEYDDQADDSLSARHGRAANVPSTDVDPGG